MTDIESNNEAPSLETPASNANATAGENADPVEASAASAPSPEAPAPTESVSSDQATAPSADASSETPADAATSAASPGEGAKKKRKRRRKKKKPKVDGEKPVKTAAQVPFLSYFEGGERKHAFSSGEVIAGRVAKVEEGVITVDLFGKATAYADILEPRDIPVMPPKPAPKKKAQNATAETTDATTEATTEATTAEATTAEAATAEAATETTADVTSEATADSSATLTDQQEALRAELVREEVAAVTADSSASLDENQEELRARLIREEIEEAAAALAELQSELRDESVPPGHALPQSFVGEPPPVPEVGAIFRGRVGSVTESGHIAIINRIVDKKSARERIRAASDRKQRVLGVVYGFNRGGFDVLVDGVRTFCPAGGMDLSPISDPIPYLGKKLEFSVPPKRGGGKSIIVSRRGILERQQRKAARDRLGGLKVGEKLSGTVVDIRDYGVLVDIGGGVSGLVHLSEIAWGRGGRPSELVSKGQEVDVEVLKVQPAGRKDRFGKLSLSIRKCLPDPWGEADLRVGAFYKGKVTRTAEFGAFVEILPGIEALLHISELGGRDLKHAKHAISEGTEIDVVIERLDRGQRRISLSKLSAADQKAIASGEYDPATAPRSLKQGAHITVQVQRADHHGIQVQVIGVVGKRGRGFISNRDLGSLEGDKKNSLAPGSEVKVRVMGTDRSGRLKLSVKGLENDEERKAVKDYRKAVANQGFGTFADLLKAKLEKK